jgi:hypothetical protein
MGKSITMSNNLFLYATIKVEQMNRQIDRKTNRQMDRRTDRQTDGQTNR